MALQTTLFEAVKASHYIQLAGRNVNADYSRHSEIQDGKLHLSLGQDDDWFFLNQEIEIDESGEAQVQVCALGGDMETQPMRFLMSRPLNQNDLKNAAQV